MKKIFASMVVLALANAAYAGTSDRPVTFSLITTNSDTETYVVRGQIEAIEVDVAATKTNVILIADQVGATIFSATVSADAVYPILVPTYSTTAVQNYAGTNAVLARYPASGDITIRAAGAAGTTGTNSVSVNVIFDN